MSKKPSERIAQIAEERYSTEQLAVPNYTPVKVCDERDPRAIVDYLDEAQLPTQSVLAVPRGIVAVEGEHGVELWFTPEVTPTFGGRLEMATAAGETLSLTQFSSEEWGKVIRWRFAK